MEKCKKILVCPPIASEFTSKKRPLVISINSPKKRRAKISTTTSKAETYIKALSNAGTGTGGNECGKSIIDTEVDTTPFFLQPWAVYPGNTTEKLCEEVLIKLQHLYELGNLDKKRKISADHALRILIDELIYDDWEQRVAISVPRIKAFFALKPSKQKESVDNASHTKVIDQYQQLVQNIEEDEINMECMDSADTLQDLDRIPTDD